MRKALSGVMLLAWAVGGCASGGGGSADGSSGRAVDAGPLRHYSGDGTYDRFAKSDGFMLVTFGGRLTAVSSRCTADGATLEKAKAGADAFVCPRDGSKFDRNGHAHDGKARDPLVHYPMSVNSAGNVIVETNRPLGQSGWNSPGAFLIAR
jgi:nitrite reductase/ring-hydroxylating ferredoxin subunit